MIYVEKKVINVLVDGASHSGKSTLISKLSDNELHIGIPECERYQKSCVEEIINGQCVTLIFYENKNDRYLKSESAFNIKFHVYLLLYDITDDESFAKAVLQYNKYLQNDTSLQYIQSQSTLKYLLSNKCEQSLFYQIIQKIINNFPHNSNQQCFNKDIKEFLEGSNKMFQTDTIDQFIIQNGFKFYPVSCRTKTNISALKEQIVSFCFQTALYQQSFIAITKQIASQKQLTFIKDSSNIQKNSLN